MRLNIAFFLPCNYSVLNKVQYAALGRHVGFENCIHLTAWAAPNRASSKTDQNKIGKKSSPQPRSVIHFLQLRTDLLVSGSQPCFSWASLHRLRIGFLHGTSHALIEFCSSVTPLPALSALRLSADLQSYPPTFVAQPSSPFAHGSVLRLSNKPA